MIAFSAAVVLLLACGADRGDPLGPDGGASVSPGAGRTNAPVTRDNMFLAMQDMFDMLYDNFQSALSVTAMVTDPQKQVRIVGNYSGYATVSVLNQSSSTTQAYETKDLNVSYNGYYSDNGKLFITGAVVMTGAWTDGTMTKFFADGETEFSGDYACSVEFDALGIALNSAGKPIDLLAALDRGMTGTLPRNGVIKIFSASVDTIWTNPYTFDWSPVY